jgi:hypothetical protein
LSSEKSGIEDTYIGPVHLAYNPSYSACFFSRSSIFLSQKNQTKVFFSRLIIPAERLHLEILLLKLLGALWNMNFFFLFMCFSYDDEKEWIHVKFLYDSGSGEFFFIQISISINYGEYIKSILKLFLDVPFHPQPLEFPLILSPKPMRGDVTDLGHGLVGAGPGLPGA